MLSAMRATRSSEWTRAFLSFGLSASTGSQRTAIRSAAGSQLGASSMGANNLDRFVIGIGALVG